MSQCICIFFLVSTKINYVYEINTYAGTKNNIACEFWQKTMYVNNKKPVLFFLDLV